MSLLKINNLGITLSELLFTDLSFNLNKGDRLGLVAANGRKSWKPLPNPRIKNAPPGTLSWSIPALAQKHW